MHIWVDADACPNVIKNILFRATERAQVTLTLVANQLIRIPPSRFVKALQVPAGFDVADDTIVQMVQAGDLVVTADIPLAAAVIAKGGRALDPRGEFYTGENIGEKLSVRKLMDELRASGVDTAPAVTLILPDPRSDKNLVPTASAVALVSSASFARCSSTSNCSRSSSVSRLRRLTSARATTAQPSKPSTPAPAGNMIARLACQGTARLTVASVGSE